MKRVLLTFAAVGLLLTANAQMMMQHSVELPSLPDSTRVADSLWWADQPRTALYLGISAGATLYNSGNDGSPYYSQYGLQLQVPLEFVYRVSPHWSLATGLRYDLRYDPLVYAVRVNALADGNGIDFESDAVAGRQSAYAIRNYIGFPLKAKWYPWKRETNLLSITFDLYGGYAFLSHISTETLNAVRTINGMSSSVSIMDDVYETSFNDRSMLPWKLELGVTIATDVLGLVHGVRFYTDLLPVYRDPATGEGIYTAGMTIYL